MKDSSETSSEGRVGTIQFRVRYQETDQMGVVYHGNYFAYFEMGRTELLREATGRSYRDVEESNVKTVVAKVECVYHKPARYDDLLTLETRFAKCARKFGIRAQVVSRRRAFGRRARQTCNGERRGQDRARPGMGEDSCLSGEIIATFSDVVGVALRGSRSERRLFYYGLLRFYRVAIDALDAVFTAVVDLFNLRAFFDAVAERSP